MSAAPAQLNFQTACADDVDVLVALRIEAMRESLTCIGRFDPARARRRFMDGFEPAYTQHIDVDGEHIGFFVLKPQSDGLLLDHLHICPTHQGRGIGAAVLVHVFAMADASGMAVRVGAPRGSDPNRFCQRLGFELVEEGEFDSHYMRSVVV